MNFIKETVFKILTYNADNFKSEIIYIGVGSANNLEQEYPPFLNKYKKKLIILIDPELEDKLLLESKFNLNKITNNNEIKFRIFENINLKIIAINQEFDFNCNIEKTFLSELISYTIDANTKMIVNDYTGRNIQNSYLEMFDIFSKEKLLSNVIFDIT